MYQLIIADDEEIECRALEHKIRTGFPDILLLPSVYDGASLLKAVESFSPDIAIVDINMPGLNGLDAIEILKMKKLRLKVIINTSYSDFAYTQRALKFGASDYLLKPGSREELYAAIRKVLSELAEADMEKTRYQKSEATVENLYRIAAQKWLISLLFGEEDASCAALLMEKTPELSRGGYFTVWQPRFSSPEEEGYAAAGQKDERRESEILRLMQEYCTCIGCSYRAAYYLLLLKPDGNADKAGQEAIHSLLQHVLHKLGRDYSVGCSRYKGDMSQYADGVREAQAALRGLKRRGIAFFQFGKEEREDSAPFYSFAPEAASFLLLGRTEECLRETDIRISAMKVPASGNLYALRTQYALFLVDVVSLLDRHLCAEGKAFLRPLPWRSFGNAGTSSALASWVSESLQECARELSGKVREANIYVEKAILYIRENYQMDISLEDVAGRLGISSFYLSRLFTQCRDFSFVEFLTDMRLRKALTLLRDNRLNNKEICDLAGYTSTAYFYRVFKKYMGMTVGEMRESLQSE